MNRARTYRCARMRRWVDRCDDTEGLLLRPFCRDYTTAMRGYDFRKGQVSHIRRSILKTPSYSGSCARATAAMSNSIVDAPLLLSTGLRPCTRLPVRCSYGQPRSLAERYDGSAEHNAIQLSYIERSHEATQQALSCALYRFGLERGDFILARPFAVLRDFPFKIGRLPEPAASPNDRNCHGRPRAPTPNKCDIVQKFVSPDHRHSAGTRRS